LQPSFIINQTIAILTHMARASKFAEQFIGHVLWHKAHLLPHLIQVGHTRVTEIVPFNGGGAAKPSGAGGGDVVVAALPGPAETARFSAACAEAGFEVLSLDLGVIGERQEQ
jgi:mevalonate kinase